MKAVLCRYLKKKDNIIFHLFTTLKRNLPFIRVQNVGLLFLHKYNIPILHLRSATHMGPENSWLQRIRWRFLIFQNTNRLYNIKYTRWIKPADNNVRLRPYVVKILALESKTVFKKHNERRTDIILPIRFKQFKLKVLNGATKTSYESQPVYRSIIRCCVGYRVAQTHFKKLTETQSITTKIMCSLSLFNVNTSKFPVILIISNLCFTSKYNDVIFIEKCVLI
ncbi:hypothetical protein AGLY_014156 [Aphis glycines]|uniref:Uncharacterized protein n=1 Tax=Aphis glycines TaxID=307491 RepID=A0A6G0T4X6_APHGL|nr:hypothetical protein AGLY_014156 [Aphis glycines]